MPGRRLRGWFLGDEPDFRSRGVWLLLALVAMGITLVGRLADVQLVQGHRLAGLAAAQHVHSVALHAHRGRIYDSSGRLLVSDEQVYGVFADPGMIAANRRDEVARKLSTVLAMGPGQILQLINHGGRFVYLKHTVDAATQGRLADLGLAGVGTVPEERRIYNGSAIAGATFAANLLGYVNHDGTGQYGVEGYYDGLLKGQDGSDSTVQDLHHNAIVLSQDQRHEVRDGRDLRLGLDSQVQYWAEQALAKGIANAGAESGEVLVMDTKTGSIRAWADAPTYDANNYASANVGNFRDAAIDGLYEPGSTMKVVTFAGGLEKHAITPQTAMDETNTVIDGFTIHDWDGRTHGHVTMQEVLDNSLNNGAIHVMQLMGQDAFYSNLLAFGLGAPTGVDLAGEVHQPIRPQKQWRPSDYATASFGQGVSTTPVELLAAINTVANGGVWVQPHAVDAVIDPATGAQTAVVAPQHRVIAADAAATLSQMMVGVVEDKIGSGFLARIPAFKGQIAGKTGTASVPTNGKYAGEVITSFAGFMPAKNPRFTMLVVVRRPHETRVDREGAFLAAPVWKDIAQIAIDAWRITPQP
ncbi:MAG: stage V sporulation protein D [Candidatus Dormibacteria bacterium]